MLTKEQEYQILKIRSQYMGNHPSLDALWKMDAKVKTPAIIIGWLCAILGVILINIMIAGEIFNYTGNFYGMGHIMRVLIDVSPEVGYMLCDFFVSVMGKIGLVLVFAAYPVYRWVLKAREKKYAWEILQLTDQLMND